jgi:type I restriction enzyme S subunit
VNQQVVNCDYLRHLLLWPALWARLTPRGSMVRRKRTSPTMLLSAKVPLPHLAEQKTIAHRLGTVRETLELGDLQVEYLAGLHASALNAAFDHHS